MNAQTRIATDLGSVNASNIGVQRLYRMSPPLMGREYVVVSALYAAFDTGIPETYIFPADSTGQIIDWAEMDGSSRGIFDHVAALRDAGYEVSE